MELFKYILRYLICPTHHPDDRIEELVRFCSEARIQEVMFLFTAEELTDGHPTIQELQPWVEVAKKAKAQLAEVGVGISLNPWTTTFHVARGRHLKPGQNFTLMVGETGYVSPITACPLCDKWQEYLCEVFAYMVNELNPVTLWIEDDWRLHNHEPEMKFGGCFCHLHLKRFAEMVGRDFVTRQEVLDAVLGSGRPHLWREKWLGLWRDTMLEPAVKLRNALQAASPSTRVGFMSSNPDIHSIEGRDWHQLQEAWGFEPEFLIRPHLPPYTEATALQVGPDMTRLTLANLKRPLGVYPELENSPRCGIYSKSKTYTAMECLESVCYGADGITINHFDMMGNGISLDKNFAKALAKPKDMLNAIASLDIDDQNSQGAAVLFSPEVAAQMVQKSSSPKEMRALQNQSTHWGKTLAILGIAYGYTQGPVASRPVFVNGQTLRAFDDDIKELLGGTLVCDPESISILMEKGFGEYIGVDSVKYGMLNELGYGYEEIIDGRADVYGIDRPRMSASRPSDRILIMDLAEKVSVKTVIKTGSHKQITAGMVSYKNSLGGTIISTAYPLGHPQFYMGYFNIFRQKLWQEMLFELCQNSKLAAAEETPLRVYRTEIEGSEFIGIINPTLDAVEKVIIRLNNFTAVPSEIQIMSHDGKWQGGRVEIKQLQNSIQLILSYTLKPLKALFLRC